MSDFVRHAVAKLDYFYNRATGQGGPNSAYQNRGWHSDPGLSPDLLSSLWSESWLAQRILRLPIDHAFKEGFSVEQDKQALQKFRRINYAQAAYPEGCYQAAAYQGALYGGAALILGIQGSGATLDKPWVPGTGRLEWLDVANRHDLQVKTVFDDKNSADFGQPALVELKNGHRRGPQLIHASRLIWFQGCPVYGEQRQQYKNFWSDSKLRPVLQTLEQHGLAWNTIGTMVEEASLGVMTQDGLIEALGSENAAAYEARVSLMQSSKAVANLILLDAGAGEDFKRVDVNFSGLGTTLEQLQQLTAAAAQQPGTLLWGLPPSGLNATGEMDQRNFNSRIKVSQETDHGPKLGKVLQGILGTAEAPEIHWPDLYTPSKKEQEETRKLQAETDAIYADLGGVRGEEVLLARDADGTLGFEIDRAALKKALEEDKPDPEITTIPPPGGGLPGPDGTIPPPGGIIPATLEPHEESE